MIAIDFVSLLHEVEHCSRAHNEQSAYFLEALPYIDRPLYLLLISSVE